MKCIFETFCQLRNIVDFNAAGFLGFFLKRIISPLILMSVGCNANAFNVPPLRSPCQDEAGLLQPETCRRLDQILKSAFDQGGPQLQILIIPSLEGEPIENFAIKTVEQWQLGHKKVDDGILFLIAKNERKMRIEVGKGVEGDLPDVIAKRIVSQVVTPKFKTGDFDGGVLFGTIQILKYADPKILDKLKLTRGGETAEEGHTGETSGLPFQVLIFFLFVILSILSRFGGGGRGGPFSRSGGWGGGGFSSGGSGWSGGGGGFSGGGASGDW